MRIIPTFQLLYTRMAAKDHISIKVSAESQPYPFKFFRTNLQNGASHNVTNLVFLYVGVRLKMCPTPNWHEFFQTLIIQNLNYNCVLSRFFKQRLHPSHYLPNTFFVSCAILRNATRKLGHKASYFAAKLTFFVGLEKDY